MPPRNETFVRFYVIKYMSIRVNLMEVVFDSSSKSSSNNPKKTAKHTYSVMYTL